MAPQTKQTNGRRQTYQNRDDAAKARAPMTGDLINRQPPYNLEAELGVVGSIILMPDVIDDVTLLLKPDDFYDTAHGLLFQHLQEMHQSGKRIDDTLLVERLKKAGDYEAIGGAAGLSKIINAVPHAGHAMHYATIVKDKAMARRVIYEATTLLRDAYDDQTPPGDLVSSAEAAVGRISDLNLTGKETRPFNSMVIEAIEAMEHRSAGGGIVGLTTGLRELDNITSGMKPGNLCIFAGRPSMGKSALAVKAVRHICEEGLGHVYFASLEMAGTELVDRIMSAEARICGHRLQRGHLNQDDRLRLVEKAGDISSWPLHIDDNPGRSVAEIGAASRRLHRKHKLALVVIDYLQLITPENPRDDRTLQIGKISRGLKRLARELQVPVLCLAQVNRDAEKNVNQVPRLSNLREAGDIENDADLVVFVHRPEYYLPPGEAKEQAKGLAELHVAKQRQGPTGQVDVAWLENYTAFEDLAQQHHQGQLPGTF